MDKTLTYYESLYLKIQFCVLNLEKWNLHNLKDLSKKFGLMKNFINVFNKMNIYMHQLQCLLFPKVSDSIGQEPTMELLKTWNNYC